MMQANMTPEPQPTHMKVPMPVFVAMMNTLYALPYGQVAELVGHLTQSEPVFASAVGLDETPGVTVQSNRPNAASPQPTENGNNEDRQRTHPEPA